jgi:hypothetical protein
MPQRNISIPNDVHFVDPTTGLLVEGPDGVLNFDNFLAKLFCNPLWGETWQAAMAQRSIRAASRSDGFLLVSEEDWKFLETAAKNPRTMIIGPTGTGIVPGLGFHPSLAGQVVQFQLAVINAETI